MPTHPVIEHWSETRARIVSAALRYGRVPDSVGLLAISKGQPSAALREIAQMGQLDFGENYVQEALDKQAALADLPIVWHFTGQIQANKTRVIAENFSWVHAVDRERIAVRLNDQRPAGTPLLNICIQVRLEDEPGKGGIAPGEVLSFAQQLRPLSRLRLRGLMCIPPSRDSFDAQRNLFQQMRDVLDDMNRGGFELDTLSMGMSADLDAAIAAGATWVRIGTAIFGARQ